MELMGFIKVCLWSIILGSSLILGGVDVFAEQAMAEGRVLVPCGTKGQPACTICDFALGINNVVKFITGLVAVTAVVVIVIAGIMYMVSAGNQSTTEMAKTAIKNAVIGVAITLGAFVIIHFTLKAIFVKDTGVLTGATESLNSWAFNCE